MIKEFNYNVRINIIDKRRHFKYINLATDLLSIRFEDFKCFLHDSNYLHVHRLQFLCCVISVFGLEETLEHIAQRILHTKLIIRNERKFKFL